MTTTTTTTTNLPSKRPNLMIGQILADNSILDKPRPGPIPLSRRPPLAEVKNSASAASPRKRREKEKETAPEPSQQKEKRQEKPSLEREPRAKGLPPPPQQHPPSALTALLLSHSCTTPTLPPLPAPPRSRQPVHSTALSAAQSVPPPTAPTPSPSNHLLRQLRKTLETSPPRRRLQPPPPPPPAHPSPPQRRSQPPAPHPTTPPIPTITLDSLPSFTHHSEHAITSLHSPSHITLLLRSTGNIYTITRNTLTIGTSTYCIEDIPYKHLPAFRYVRRFVAAVRKRTVVAFGGVGGLHGRVWADGRGVVTLQRTGAGEGKGEGGETEVEVHFAATGETAGAEGVTTEELKHAQRLYVWLKKHPAALPPAPAPAPAPMVDGDEWELTPETRFVKAVGWCRELGEGRWSLKFLDGVRVEIRGGEVLWISREGARWSVAKGLRDEEVRRRVALFVKAGV
ncbi:hypothetical protein BZA05DRAFT_441676 [Tricharina praecox]|uniref:uncharacterized protein n=1 Tax=Tricharina praecox TaxID=43433 RepID=UPI002220962E|nr:uncharacterized protein BZA05DRAFT_441676 [Tricharina praecox]KAI5857045.1 hypothetical protein BZA05DRAFT_441676 [Tricharina praecox]